MLKVQLERQEPVFTVTLNRPEVRNAVDREAAELLYEAFLEFDKDDRMRVAVLFGEGGHFCAGRISRPLPPVNPIGWIPKGPHRWGPPGFFSPSQSSPP